MRELAQIWTMLSRFIAWLIPVLAAQLAFFVAEALLAADPDVRAVADQVSETYYREFHLDIENMGLGLYGGGEYDMGYRNRLLDSLGNQEARLYLQDKFAAMGLSVSVQSSLMNVVGELPGTVTPENIYIVGGHYDHIPGDSPGGDDNASGTAGVLEAARVLSQYRFESTIRFIGFNAEEILFGNFGSFKYVDEHVLPAGENIVGMVNMDMILRPGCDDDPHAVIDADLGTLIGHEGSVTWAQAYQQAAADYVPSLNVDATIFDFIGSDHSPFVHAGYPAFLVIENANFWSCNEYFHTSEDASDRLANDPNSPSGVTYDFAFATDVTRTAVALIAQEAVLVHEPTGCDINRDGVCDVRDIDAMTQNVRTGINTPADRVSLIESPSPIGFNTFIGDANLDGEFNSSDLITVFEVGEYEDTIVDNSSWAEGDWNGDADFTSGDLVVAFQDGGYEQGSREEIAAVPEPSELGLLTLAIIGIGSLFVPRIRWLTV